MVENSVGKPIAKITETGDVKVNSVAAFRDLFDALPKIGKGKVKSISVYASAKSAGQSVLVKRPKDDEVAAFIAGVTGVVETTREEQHALWERFHCQYGVTWKENNSGIAPTVGFFGDMPVCVTLYTAIVGGAKLLFVEATSQVVDYRLIDEWLDAMVPDTARRSDGRINKTDAANFSHVLPDGAMQAGKVRNVGLQEALEDARRELAEAADKFWVIHCNHPGEVAGRAQGEDKEFCAQMHKRMHDAHGRTVEVLKVAKEGGS